ncbi:MAG: hypothetical protein ACI9OH_001293, partial [Oleispira sp.]
MRCILASHFFLLSNAFINIYTSLFIVGEIPWATMPAKNLPHYASPF